MALLTDLLGGLPFGDQLLAVVALAIGLYWAYLLYRRSVDSSDPSMRKFSSSALGSMSMVVSGVYFSALLAGGIAVVTWPAPMETPWLGALLLGGVVFHAILEYRESRGGGLLA